jgi:hypothetical protein
MKRENYISLSIAALLLSACGATSSNFYGTSSGETLGTSSTSGSTLATTTTGTTVSTTTTTTTTGTASPITMTVRGIGYTSTSVTVSANQVLKVEFAPGVQDTAVAGTGVYPQYSQLGVYIQVGSLNQPTEMLTNGYNGTTAETSSVIDFSSYIPSGSCAGKAATCRENVTITVNKPNDDYWCLTSGQFCPWSYVYASHPWNGTLTIQTDDTTAI